MCAASYARVRLRWARWFRERPGTCVAIALALWGLSLVTIALLVLGGHVRVDVWPVYSAAAHRWSTHRALYETNNIDGFQYFPQAAMLFGVFARLGEPLAGVVWRASGWSLLAHATWRASALASGSRRKELFLIATAIVIPPALISLKNGQANLHIAALMMEVAIDLSRRRLWHATLWATIGLGAKPIMAVMILLMCVQYPSMIWRTVIGVGLLFVAPAAVAPAAYVGSQYRDCVAKLVMSAQPNRFFEDLHGLAWRLGVLIPLSVLCLLQLLAALGAVALSLRVRKRWKAPAAGLLLFAVAATYLMLFNSRTQANSYVILAPAAALAAAVFVLRRRTGASLTMLVLVACWCGSALPLTEFWLKPLAAVVFCVLLVRQILVGDETFLDTGDVTPSVPIAVLG